MMFTFKIPYFFLTVILFVVEVLIAIFLHDDFIRPYVGDFLVVILLYCFFKIFVKASVLKVAVGVLLFAYVVEVLQHFKLLKTLGLQKSKLANIIMGNSFEWFDMVAYTLGILAVLLIEKLISSQNPTLNQPLIRKNL